MISSPSMEPLHQFLFSVWVKERFYERLSCCGSSRLSRPTQLLRCEENHFDPSELPFDKEGVAKAAHTFLYEQVIKSRFSVPPGNKYDDIIFKNSLLVICLCGIQIYYTSTPSIYLISAIFFSCILSRHGVETLLTLYPKWAAKLPYLLAEGRAKLNSTRWTNGRIALG